MVSGDFAAGVATRDVTPEKPGLFKLLGIPRRENTRGVLHPLRAEALAMTCGDTALWVVTCDEPFVREGLTGPVRRRVSEALGRMPVHMMFGATHCHSAESAVPEDPTQDMKEALAGQRRMLEDALVEACLEAHARRVPAETAAATVNPLERLGTSRRMLLSNGTCLEHWAGSSLSLPGEKRMGLEAPAPDRIDVIGLRARGSRDPFALLTSYPSHIHLIPLPLIDGEVAGAAKREMERRHPGITALYAVGTAGDTAMHPTCPPPPSGKLPEEQAWYEGQLRILGGRFADAVDRAVATFAYEPPRSLDFAEYQSNEPRDVMSRHQPKAGILIQAAALGRAALLNVQGEIFSQYGREIHEDCPFPHLVTVGYNERGYSYIGTDRAYEQGSYEIKGILPRSAFEEQTLHTQGVEVIPPHRLAVGHGIVDQSCKLLRELADRRE